MEYYLVEGNLVEGREKIHIHSQFEGMYVTLYRLITSNFTKF